MPPSDWPRPHRASNAPNTAFVAIVATLAIGVMAIAGLLRLADELGPQTGDIISFPARKAATVSPTAIEVHPAGASPRVSCTLDVGVIQRSGGSLVIEATQHRPDRGFLVHWSGVRTSRGADDCGRSIDLLLNPVQVAALVFAAGGIGARATDDSN